MTVNFYRSFEDRFRGSRELIKSRLCVYLPFIEAILALYSDAKVIDLGCGRGEWLELLKGLGVDAHGVDMDEGMLSACREAGLSVETDEAVAYLKMLPAESQAIVSGFHIAEHIPFADLQTLVQEALRVLRPAGLLILETPNPENVVVATVSFYVDPTHQRPIPPELLAFLPEYYGFFRTKILRLHGSSDLLSSKQPSLTKVFNGASPDYAIVAQKNTSPEDLKGFSVCFDNEYGLTFDALSTWYDEQLQTNAELAEFNAKRTDNKVEQILTLMQQADVRAEQMLGLIRQTEARTQQTINELDAVYQSNSWRVTAPLRWLAFQLKLLYQHGPLMRIKALLRKCAKPIAKYVISFLNHRPEFRRFCLKILRNIGLYERLKSYYISNYRDFLYADNLSINKSTAAGLAMLQLTPRSQRIYLNLINAIEKQQGTH